MSQKLVMNLLAHVLPFFLLVHFSFGLYEIEVHRMLGYEEGDRWMGSKVQSFTMVAAHFAGESLRKLAMINFEEIDETALENLFQRKPGGILIILPHQFKSKEVEVKIWKLINEFIGPRVQNMPVYFCWEGDQVLKLYQQKQANTTDPSNEVQFQVVGAEPKQVSQLSFEDIYSSFDDVNTYRQSNPTLMVVVGADSNLPSAEMSVPLENQGFQLELYFQLVKSLKYVYQTYQRRDQNILFYFTTTTSLNYEGIKKFFAKPENQRTVNSVENVLILENIQSSGPYFMEVQASSYSTQKEKLDALLKVFKESFVEQGLAVLERANAELIIKSKDVNVIKLTSSEDAQYQSMLTPQTRGSFNQVKMHNALLQALLKIAYGINQNLNEVIKLQYYQANNEIQEQDESFTEGIYDFFNSTNRHVTNVQRDSKFSLELTKIFNGLFKNSQKSTYVYKDRIYYTSQATKANVLRFISAFLDLYLFIGVISWLGILFLIFKHFDIIPMSQENRDKKRR